MTATAARDATAGPNDRGDTTVSNRALGKLIEGAAREVSGVDPFRADARYEGRDRVSAEVSIALRSDMPVSEACEALHAHVERRLHEWAGAQLEWLDITVAELALRRALR